MIFVKSGDKNKSSVEFDKSVRSAISAIRKRNHVPEVLITMAYDEYLASRIRKIIGDDETVVEKKMFGGIAFMVNGNMACGIVDQSLMVRFAKEKTQEILSLAHAREMDFTGKTMRGFAFVDPPGIESDADLSRWIEVGRGFAQSLPPK